MADDVHYQKLVDAILDKTDKTEEEAKDADQRLFDLIEASQQEKYNVQHGMSNKTLQELHFEYSQQLQDFWEDTFGEDTWDDRHELYPYQE